MGAKVLVVDDSGFVRQHVGRVLRAAGFDIVEAADGDQALAALAADGEIALVFCDVNMPQRSGLEMLEALAGDPAGRRPPVVMLTTEGQRELIVRAKALGAMGWIVKPFKPELLVLTAQKLTGASTAAEPAA